MKATEELLKEHTAIMLMLDIMEKVSVRIEGATRVPQEHVVQMLDFLRTFADGCHHSKEEECLFPALEAVGIPRERGPIGVMLSEHELGRKHVNGMSGALSGLQGGDGTASAAFVSEARAYINLLRMHIYKENNILFPMADLRLTEIQQSELLNAFERIETEKVGAGKHEHYHALLKSLKEFYQV